MHFERVRVMLLAKKSSALAVLFGGFMSDTQPQTIYLKDYRVPPFLIDSIDLRCELGETHTDIQAVMHLQRNPQSQAPAKDLLLHGQDMELLSVAIDDKPLNPDQYQLNANSLRLLQVPQRFVLTLRNRIKPQDNKALEGLYKSSGNFCTQCEPEGFRRITYYLDRPDVMSRFTTTIVGDKTLYPVMLSNGNLVDQGELDDGQHWVKWEDPFPKPSYLFALVAGQLVRRETSFTTMSGRDVPIHIYVQAQNADQCDHALEAVKKSMRWDEEVYGREYDLDVFQIVAVDDFNMGAMENKGLNIFNSKYVLARADTATDADFEGVVGVIGHEYFHNWSGDRVTCRDWFQLSLKEGFTVFRDQSFTADMTSDAVKRIKDVNILRSAQFREDGGPLAHPVRPPSYVEVNNFYTLTVYNKGAEVVRMIHTLLGRETFRAGTDLYFSRHDGQAATVDQFVQAMEEVSGRDLGQFKLWYSQAGTPDLDFSGHFDAANKTYTLDVSQRCAPSPGQQVKNPFHIPVVMGLLGADGQDLNLRLQGEAVADAAPQRLLELREAKQRFVFIDVDSDTAPIPSLLRGFSAPVRSHFDYSDTDLAFLMAHDSDAFNRWDAGQQLAERVLLRLSTAQRQGQALQMDDNLIEAMRTTLRDDSLDRRLKAQALVLPNESYLAEQIDEVDPGAIHEARQFVLLQLAEALREDFEQVWQANQTPGDYQIDGESVGKRQLRNTCLAYLSELEDPKIVQRCALQFEQANNMTDVLAALSLLADLDSPERQQALESFYRKWQDQPLVVDKWLSIQATAKRPGVFDEVQKLMQHPSFSLDNPNKVRALVGAFTTGNPAHFHHPSGQAYSFLADQVLALNAFNPLVAARLLNPMSGWKRFEPGRRALMQAQLQRILAAPGLSKNVYEIASKSLG